MKQPNELSIRGAEAILARIPYPPFDVSTRTGRLIAHVDMKEVIILDPNRAWLFNNQGVIIPEFLRQKFEDKSVIFPKDPLFFRAFVLAGCWDFLREGYLINPSLSSEETPEVSEDITFIQKTLEEVKNSVLPP